MLQRTDFINEIRVLQRTQMSQRTRRNTIGRRSTRVRMKCWAFPLWFECQSPSFVSFVRFSYQVSSAVCLLEPSAVKIYTGCPTTYQTRQFFNNSKTNEDIATRFGQEYVRCVRNEKECVCSKIMSVCVCSKVIKELPGLVGSGTPCIMCTVYAYRI